VSSGAQFISADKGKRSFTIANARQVKISVYQENDSDVIVSAEGKVSLKIENTNFFENTNVKTILFEQEAPNATFNLDSESPYFAIIETDEQIEATLRTDLSNDKLIYEQGENINFNVSVSGATAQSVSGTLLRTSDVEGNDDNSQLATALQFKRIGNQFVAVQKGNLPAGIYNVTIQVQGATFIRHIVTSIAVVSNERSIIKTSLKT